MSILNNIPQNHICSVLICLPNLRSESTFLFPCLLFMTTTHQLKSSSIIPPSNVTLWTWFTSI